MKLLVLSVIALAAFPACNTTVGLGRDLRVLGTEMERKADETYSGGAATNDYGGAPVY